MDVDAEQSTNDQEEGIAPGGAGELARLKSLTSGEGDVCSSPRPLPARVDRVSQSQIDFRQIFTDDDGQPPLRACSAYARPFADGDG